MGFLQLSRVRDACAEFLMARLSPNNVLGIKSFADSLGCSILVAACHKFVKKFFAKVAETEEFLALTLDEVSTLVGEDELFVISEAFVFNAVLSWVKVDRDNRSEHLPFLLAKVRLPLLTPQFLSDTVASDELIGASHKCRDLLDEARDYHLMPERRSLMQSFRTKPRRCRDIIGSDEAEENMDLGQDEVVAKIVRPPVRCYEIMFHEITFAHDMITSSDDEDDDSEYED